MSNVSEDLVNKVRGLLRLSKSDNPHEAELAMERAKRLCVKNDLELASIDPEKTKNDDEPIEHANIDLGRSRLPMTQHNVSRILNKHFNVRVIYTGNRYRGKQLILVGRKRDVEIASWVNDFLNREFVRFWKGYYEKNKQNFVTLKDRASYYYGLELGLSEKLKQAEEKEKAVLVGDKAEEIKNRYALVNVSLKRKINDKVGELFPSLRRGRHSNINIRPNSFLSGKTDGAKINICRPLSQGQSNNRLTV